MDRVKLQVLEYWPEEGLHVCRDGTGLKYVYLFENTEPLVGKSIEVELLPYKYSGFNVRVLDET